MAKRPEAREKNDKNAEVIAEAAVKNSVAKVEEKDAKDPVIDSELVKAAKDFAHESTALGSGMKYGASFIGAAFLGALVLALKTVQYTFEAAQELIKAAGEGKLSPVKPFEILIKKALIEPIKDAHAFTTKKGKDKK